MAHHISSYNTILVVDDSRINRHMLSRLLAKEGYQVLVAENGLTAFDVLAKQDVDLVLLDVEMPDVGGYEVLARIREKRSVTDLPVIMVTARDQSADIVRALELEANDFVTKPIDFPVTLARIRTHLFLKFKNELLNALTLAQADFISTNDLHQVFGELLKVLVKLTQSQYGFIGEVSLDNANKMYLNKYAQTWPESEVSAPDLDDMSVFLNRLMNSGTTLKCQADKSQPEARAVFQNFPDLQNLCFYPLSSRNEHLGIVGFANRQGGYDAEISQQLYPVWQTCSNIFAGIKSDRRQQAAERALKTSEARTRTILESAVDGIIAVNAKGEIEMFNRAAEHIFGFGVEEVIGQDIAILVPASYGTMTQKYISRYLRTRKGQTIPKGQELIGQRKDGSVFPMSLSVNEATYDEDVLFIGIVRDITEEKKTREQIQFQKTVLECQSNASLDGILVVDNSRRWLFYNRQFLDIWGFSQDLDDKSKSEERLQQIIDKVENTQAFVDKIHHLYRNPHASSRDEIHLKDGRILDRYSAPVESDLGVSYGRVWYYRDITQRKEAEIALAEAREREMHIGSRIQKMLLLGKTPVGLSGIEVASFSLASQRVDGDFYDFYVHSDWCLDVVVGDVMGKGIPAALLGAATKSQFLDALRQLVVQSAWHTLPSPEDIVAHVHENTTEQLSDLETFITASYARIDMERQCLTFVDCGHTGTIHYRRKKDDCKMLKGDNIPLGIFENEVYAQQTVQISPGDVLFFYSDGLTEAQNLEGTYFGEAGLIDLVQKNHQLSPSELLELVQEEAYSFCGKTQFADDLTCVVVKLSERPEPDMVLHKEIHIQSHAENLQNVRHVIKELFANLDTIVVDEKTVFFIQLAVQEALANIIEHAYNHEPNQPIWIDFNFMTDALTITITHLGKSFAPPDTLSSDFEGLPEGGFGLFIMSESMDDVTYYCDENRREVIQMVKRWLS